MPQVALAWLLARSPAVLPIPATTSPAHLRENLAAQDLGLTATELGAITALTPEEPPGWGTGPAGSITAATTGTGERPR